MRLKSIISSRKYMKSNQFERSSPLEKKLLNIRQKYLKKKKPVS